MNSSSATKAATSKTASIGTKLWMLGSVIVETVLTCITWAVQPLFFKIWSVVCLMIDAFLIFREFVLNPINQKKLAY
jgi:hypothetical protein